MTFYYDAIDACAGAGGWSEATRMLGLTEVGIELDPHACATRHAAGHLTVRADIAKFPVQQLCGKVAGVIASPPCQGMSTGGLRTGWADFDAIRELLTHIAAGRDSRAEYASKVADPRSLLIVEPLRYALAIHPEWVTLEQVPAVLPLWEETATHLSAAGYATWTGVLNAADYGVAQTRKRAILIASRIRTVSPPAATHYDPRGGDQLFGDPWVSMADALDWRGPLAARVDDTRGQRTTPGGNEFSVAGPSWALTEKTRSWMLRNNTQKNAAARSLDRPAGTLFFGARCNDVSWVHPESDVAPVRITLEESAVLQSFRRDYPWQGSRTKAFLQCGNAVPPRLAAAVIGAATGLDWQSAVEREYAAEYAATT